MIFLLFNFWFFLIKDYSYGIINNKIYESGNNSVSLTASLFSKKYFEIDAGIKLGQSRFNTGIFSTLKFKYQNIGIGLGLGGYLSGEFEGFEVKPRITYHSLIEFGRNDFARMGVMFTHNSFPASQQAVFFKFSDKFFKALNEKTIWIEPLNRTHFYHFLMGFGLSTYLCLGNLFEYGEIDNEAQTAIIVFVAGTGLLKEAYDVAKGGKVSFLDFLFTTIGGVIPVIILRGVKR